MQNRRTGSERWEASWKAGQQFRVLLFVTITIFASAALAWFRECMLIAAPRPMTRPVRGRRNDRIAPVPPRNSPFLCPYVWDMLHITTRDSCLSGASVFGVRQSQGLARLRNLLLIPATKRPGCKTHHEISRSVRYGVGHATN
jgi:hypothetical protein